MSYSDYLENEIQDHIHGVGAFTMPTTVYIGLYSVAPTDAGGGTELTGNGYARQAVSFGASSGGVSLNDAIVTFTASGGDWSAAIHAGLFDALTGGNMLEHNAITSVTVTDGSDYDFAVGQISSTVS